MMRRPIIASVVLMLTLGPAGTLAAEEQPPARGLYGPVGSLTAARAEHTATLLHDGRVLVIGGNAPYEHLASAEAWDPATEMVEPAGALSVARVNHSATLLPDGRVLVIVRHHDGFVSEPLASVVVCCQPGGGAGSTAVTRPSPSPFDGPPQRVELPEAGFAVSIPGNWEVRRYEPCEVDRDPPTTWAAAYVAVDEPSMRSCSFETGAYYPPPGRRGMAHAEPTLLVEWLELPAGRALLMEDRQDPQRTSVYYGFERGANTYGVTCSAAEPPEDRWLSVAASFEYLRDDPHVMLVLPGATMTFPIEWNVLEDRGQLAGAPGWQKVLWATDRSSYCRVAYDSRTSDPERELTPDELFDEYFGYLRLSASGTVEPVIVALPLGSAWRADWSAGPENRVTHHSLYQVTVGETSLRLACLAGPWVDAPGDRWLSLVRSIVVEVD